MAPDSPSSRRKRRLHIHWHRIVHDTGVHFYGECRCGSRKVNRVRDGWQPVNRAWLEGGAWDQRPTRPPRRPVA